ncbi:hypothetical protein [Corynebacterium singulare]|uniref:hypothetical protein n=1 Tax=Corynebacterium singulare TaxID=161899 RepID=UPI00119CA478|nr:hypothetical protein [Corynebacterium singulare]
MGTTPKDANSRYLDNLARELRLLNINGAELDQALSSVKEVIHETDVRAEDEFGPAKEYAYTLYPDSSPRQFYLFTLLGMILAVAGFIGLHLYFGVVGVGDVGQLVKYAPLLLIPAGMGIDVARYRNA